MQLCEQCGKHPANVHVTQITPAGSSMTHLCEQCARANGIEIKIAPEGDADAASPSTEAPQPVCQRCGLSFAAVREQGRLGCAACYDAFSDEIDRMLNEMHGSCTHRGKRYSRIEGALRGSEEDIARLRGELDAAICSENFEEAARLRDTIHALSTREG